MLHFPTIPDGRDLRGKGIAVEEHDALVPDVPKVLICKEE